MARYSRRGDEIRLASWEPREHVLVRRVLKDSEVQESMRIMMRLAGRENITQDGGDPLKQIDAADSTNRYLFDRMVLDSTITEELEDGSERIIPLPELFDALNSEDKRFILIEINTRNGSVRKDAEAATPQKDEVTGKVVTFPAGTPIDVPAAGDTSRNGVGVGAVAAP